ncbi:MAG: redox-sensing transcriptional repressor Rex [Candidatus Omnitrophica bacterium]|nr:redox-sensing transcriptional repressor Rex [Candidatus Omnitrophota bacterium]
MPRHPRIPDAGVTRLSLYLRELSRLEGEGASFVSSAELARALTLTSAQVRRDLSYFGQFGTSGRGYEIRRLKRIIPRILGLEGRMWRVALVGSGNLGSALLAYRGFRERGFVIKAVFDKDPRKVGRVVAGQRVEEAGWLADVVRGRRIQIGIIAVPAVAAQEVCRRLVRGGVRAILNFAPVSLAAPPHVKLRNVDLSVELESLSYYLSSLNANR